LDEKHPGKYFVFNVSEKQYSKERFDGRIADYNWQDHHAPPFHLLFELVDQMKKWLEGKLKYYFQFVHLDDPENVVVIHCMSGKGRAGTSTCCLLLFTGFYDSIYNAA